LRLGSTEANLRFKRPVIHKDGKVEIPTGASARICGGRQVIEIKDWRRRSKRIPGASITSRFGKVDLNKESSEIEIPGVGWVVYKR